MKYIFDFDDVLFYNTLKFKVRMYAILETRGVPKEMARIYYSLVREKEFDLRAFIASLLERVGGDTCCTEEIYQEIMLECNDFTNQVVLPPNLRQPIREF